MFRKLRFPVVCVIIVICCLLAVIVFTKVSAAQNGGYQYGRTRSLVGATNQQIGQYAVDYTTHHFQVITGTPQVVLVKSVKAEDLPGLGLDSVSFESVEKPPLVLVIVKGSFGFGNISAAISLSAMKKWQATYVSYVFDIWSAEAASTITSVNGGIFRKVLNDPTLPDDDTPNANQYIDDMSQLTPSPPDPNLLQVQLTPNQATGNKPSAITALPNTTPVHYGDYVPPVAVPTKHN